MQALSLAFLWYPETVFVFQKSLNSFLWNQRKLKIIFFLNINLPILIYAIPKNFLLIVPLHKTLTSKHKFETQGSQMFSSSIKQNQVVTKRTIRYSLKEPPKVHYTLQTSSCYLVSNHKSITRRKTIISPFISHTEKLHSK